MHQETASQQDHVLGNGKSHPAQDEDPQQSSIGEMLDVNRNKTSQASVPLGVMIAQHATMLFDRQALVGQLGRFQRLTRAAGAFPAMLVAVAVEQILMSDFLVTATIAMKLREKRRILGRDCVSVTGRSEEAI